MGKAPFWKEKHLDQMTKREWESLCDGCGKCCLHKLEHEDGEITYTNVACRLLDLKTCRCTNYAKRSRIVPDCVGLTAANIETLNWMPSTCAYRLLAEGKDLPWWHPLVSGDPDTVHDARMSVLGRAVPEEKAGALELHLVKWAK